MPTIVSHAVAALAAGQWYRDRPLPVGFWALTGCCAMLPDADVISFALGVPYEHVLGHRGLSHSLAAAACVGAVCAWACRAAGLGLPPVRLWLYFTLVTASHGLLDALTDGGRGVALLAPFDDRRIFFPWRPIRVSPIGIGFLTARTADGSLRALEVIRSELLWIWAPMLALAWFARRRPPRRRDP